MSTDTLPPNVPEEASTGLGLDDLRAMLLALVPEAGAPVRWIDITGAAHEAPPYASARQQLALLETIRGSLPKVQQAILEAGDAYGLKDASNAKGAAGIASLMAVVTEPTALNTLERMFEILHPVSLQKAAKNAGWGGSEVHAADLFGVEEMIRAVLPFSVRPVVSLMDQLAPAGEAATGHRSS